MSATPRGGLMSRQPHLCPGRPVTSIPSPRRRLGVGRRGDRALARCGHRGAFSRRVARRTLSFEPLGDGRFRDRQTGSTWDITGRAVTGDLAGTELRRVVHDQQFWFALAAFLPDARIAGRTTT
jgi:hypothetical protein